MPAEITDVAESVNMTVPQFDLIADAMLASEGFVDCERLAVPLCALLQSCKEELSKQRHYDFGMRKLKSVTRVAGVDGRLKITIALDNIQWGDGARGVDFTLHVSGGLKVTIAGTTLLALSISEQGAVKDIVDLDKLPNPFDSL